MTIDKALEVITENGRKSETATWLEYWEAILLGKEGLKQLKEERELHVGFWTERLPGETKE